MSKPARSRKPALNPAAGHTPRAALALPVVLGLAFVRASYYHWTGAALGAVSLPIFFGVLLRVGTLAAAAAFSTFYMVNFARVSDPAHWRFAATLVPGLVAVGVVCYGFATSTGVFRGARPLANRSEPAF